MMSSFDTFASLMESFETQYEQGQVEALSRSMAEAVRERHEASHALGFLLLFAKVVLELDGPLIQLRTICESARAIAPDDLEVQRYVRLLGLWEAMESAPYEAVKKDLLVYCASHPMCPHGRALLAKHVYFHGDGSTAAIQSLKEAVLLRPQYGRAWQLLGLIQLGEGEDEAASESLRKSFELDPSSVLAPAFKESLRKIGESKRAGKFFPQPA